MQFQGIAVPLEVFEESKRDLFEEFGPEIDDHQEYWLDPSVEKDIRDYEKQSEDKPRSVRYPTRVWDLQIEKLHILRAIGAHFFNLETRTAALVADTMTQSITTQGAEIMLLYKGTKVLATELQQIKQKILGLPQLTG